MCACWTPNRAKRSRSERRGCAPLLFFRGLRPRAFRAPPPYLGKDEGGQGGASAQSPRAISTAGNRDARAQRDLDLSAFLEPHGAVERHRRARGLRHHPGQPFGPRLPESSARGSLTPVPGASVDRGVRPRAGHGPDRAGRRRPGARNRSSRRQPARVPRPPRPRNRSPSAGAFGLARVMIGRAVTSTEGG
jgi:hypothetical protein